MNIAVSIACISFAGVSLVLWQRQRRARREAYIRDFILPKGLFEKLREHHPDLSLKDCQLVAQGLRQFFLAHLKSGKKYVAMPSQVVDDLWHEFILYTKNYQHFCRHAFGSFLHHTPAVVLNKGQQDGAGIRRTWHHACREENINPYIPTRLPLLFALDSKFNIPNGFVYVPDCRDVRRRGDDGTSGAGAAYCGAELSGSAAGCGGDASGIDGGNGCGGGDSDGCGGGGCGGGGD